MPWGRSSDSHGEGVSGEQANEKPGVQQEVMAPTLIEAVPSPR